MTIDYRKINETYRYQMHDDVTVRCEAWPIIVNGRDIERDLIVPLPDAPDDLYDGVMRMIRERALQELRRSTDAAFLSAGKGKPRIRFGTPKPVHVPAECIFRNAAAILSDTDAGIDFGDITPVRPVD